MNKTEILKHYRDWVFKGKKLDPEPNYEIHNDRFLVKMIYDLFELKTQIIYEEERENEEITETEIIKEIKSIPKDILNIIYEYGKYRCLCGKGTDNEKSVDTNNTNICDECIMKNRRCNGCKGWSHPNILCYLCSNAETEYMRDDTNEIDDISNNEDIEYRRIEDIII